MSKELEALKRIETTFSMNKQGRKSVYIEYTNSVYPYYEDFNLVLNALQRLESIDNANSSEALECLERLDNMEFNRSIETYVPVIDRDISETQYLCNTNEFYTIKQALLKAQEQEKVLEIIRRKGLPLIERNMIIQNENYEQYCTKYDRYNMINASILKTEEEFDLLKRYCNQFKDRSE